MADSRRREEWQHTAPLMALIANCHRSPDDKEFEPADFDPFHRRPAANKAIPVGIGVLKDVFINQRVPDQAL